MAINWTETTGIALAALLASIGYLGQVRTEHKRSARRVLYLLLEIRFNLLAALFDPKEATDQYIEHFVNRCRAEGVSTQAISLPEVMRTKVTNHFEQSVVAAKSDLEVRLLRDYEESLLQLASVRPTLAYRLLGRNRLEKLVGLTRTYGQEITSSAIGDVEEQWTKDLLATLLSKAQREVFTEIQSILDADVLILSKNCGFLEHRRCRQLLKQSSLQMNNDILREINPMISQLLHLIIEAAKQEKSKSLPETPVGVVR